MTLDEKIDLLHELEREALELHRKIFELHFDIAYELRQKDDADKPD